MLDVVHPHNYSLPAAAPLHWIYDQEEVKRITSNGTIAFVPEPHCPYYHIPTGTNSAYGAQVFVTLRDMAANKGDHSPAVSVIVGYMLRLCYRRAGNIWGVKILVQQY